MEERLKETYCYLNPDGPRPESDAEIVELIAKMKNQKSISNNSNYRTSFGDKWPSVSTSSVSTSSVSTSSVSTSSGLIPLDERVVGFRLREKNLIIGMECALQYRCATREKYASIFDEVINLTSQMCTQLSING